MQSARCREKYTDLSMTKLNLDCLKDCMDSGAVIEMKKISSGELRYRAALIEVGEVLLTLETGDQEPTEDSTLSLVISVRNAS